LTQLPENIQFNNNGYVYLPSLTQLPENIQFNNKGYVSLDSLTQLPENIQFNNGGSIYLDSLTQLPENIQFNNEGSISLNSLTQLPENIQFNNEGYVSLDSLTQLPENIQFNNEGYVSLDSLTQLPENIQFNNKGDVLLSALTQLPENIQFNNEGSISLDSLTQLPENKYEIFRNRGEVFYSWNGDMFSGVFNPTIREGNLKLDWATITSYSGEYKEDPATGFIYEVYKNGKPLPLKPSLELANHSPTGFSWGYMGSGPSQLALAILLDYSNNPSWAKYYYQRFKEDIISNLHGKSWEFTNNDIEVWMRENHIEPPSEDFKDKLFWNIPPEEGGSISEENIVTDEDAATAFELEDYIKQMGNLGSTEASLRLDWIDYDKVEINEYLEGCLIEFDTIALGHFFKVIVRVVNDKLWGTDLAVTAGLAKDNYLGWLKMRGENFQELNYWKSSDVLNIKIVERLFEQGKYSYLQERGDITGSSLYASLEIGDKVKINNDLYLTNFDSNLGYRSENVKGREFDVAHLSEENNTVKLTNGDLVLDKRLDEEGSTFNKVAWMETEFKKNNLMPSVGMKVVLTKDLQDAGREGDEFIIVECNVGPSTTGKEGPHVPRASDYILLYNITQREKGIQENYDRIYYFYQFLGYATREELKQFDINYLPGDRVELLKDIEWYYGGKVKAGTSGTVVNSWESTVEVLYDGFERVGNQRDETVKLIEANPKYSNLNLDWQYIPTYEIGIRSHNPPSMKFDLSFDEVVDIINKSSVDREDPDYYSVMYVRRTPNEKNDLMGTIIYRSFIGSENDEINYWISEELSKEERQNIIKKVRHPFRAIVRRNVNLDWQIIPEYSIFDPELLNFEGRRGIYLFQSTEDGSWNVFESTIVKDDDGTADTRAGEAIHTVYSFEEAKEIALEEVEKDDDAVYIISVAEHRYKDKKKLDWSMKGLHDEFNENRNTLYEVTDEGAIKYNVPKGTKAIAPGKAFNFTYNLFNIHVVFLGIKGVDPNYENGQKTVFISFYDFQKYFRKIEEDPTKLDWQTLNEPAYTVTFVTGDTHIYKVKRELTFDEVTDIMVIEQQEEENTPIEVFRERVLKIEREEEDKEPVEIYNRSLSPTMWFFLLDDEIHMLKEKGL
ncbi:MAG: DUF6166 domain-containing protein, partial [Novosphingobium sp.]|nr:DUF6166 domain-containing protein [Novosphingobium sp.]